MRKRNIVIPNVVCPQTIGKDYANLFNQLPLMGISYCGVSGLVIRLATIPPPKSKTDITVKTMI